MRGPLYELDVSPYRGVSVEEVIRRNPLFIIKQVKGGLYLSPAQAELFSLVTDGGEIPLKYIKEFPPMVSPLVRFPDYDFEPSEAPFWWEDYKREIKTHPDKVAEIAAKYYEIHLEDLRKYLQ